MSWCMVGAALWTLDGKLTTTAAAAAGVAAVEGCVEVATGVGLLFGNVWINIWNR